MNLLKNLAVLSIPKHQELTQESKWFIPESCERKVIVIPQRELVKVPKHILHLAKKCKSNAVSKRSEKVDTGEDGYQKLLKIACGLEAKKVGEPHILGQIRDKWNEYIERNPTRAGEFKTTMRSLFEDAKKIRRSILEKLRPTSIARVATKLAGIKGGENILIIGANQAITNRIGHALGKDGKKSVGTITVTHKDIEGVLNRAIEFEEEQKEKRMMSEIDYVAIEDALSKINSFDHVFICEEMLDQEFDQKIIDAWKSRKRKDGHIAHLKGDNNYLTNTQWKNSNLENFINPEKITLLYRKETEANEQIIQDALIACSNCALARSRGKKPIARFLTAQSYLAKAKLVS